MGNSGSYRVGIIGCGGIARAHTSGYGLVEATQVVAGADPVEAQRIKFEAEHPGVRTYATHQEMLDKEDLDLVSVCTWPPLHAEGVIDAAEHKPKGILCEKPFALSLGEVDAMLEACERNDVKIIVGHQRRYNQRYAEAKAALDRGEIGDLVEIVASSGGDLLTCGSHSIDLIRFFADDVPIKWVMGQVHFGRDRESTTEYGHEAEQAALGRFEFENGVRGMMEQGWLITPAGEERWRRHWYVVAQGTRGTIEVDGDKKPEHPWPTGWRIRRLGETEWEEHPCPNEPHAVALEIQDLVRWIEQGGDHPLNGRNARADHEILMAIYESCRSRSRIELPLKVSDNPLISMVQAGQIP